METADKPLEQLLSILETEKFESVKERFGEILKPYRLRKGRLLVEKGEVNTHIYFIEKGVIRSYYQKGMEDITSRLVAEGDIACIAESFFSKRPSEEVMETLEDSVVYGISYDDYRQLAAKEHLIAELIIRLLEQRLVNFCEKVRLFKSLSVEQRIEYYLKDPASLFRRIPDHYIASYLGTTPSTFSRCLKVVLND